MSYAVVPSAVAAQFQHYTKGVHCVEFRELKDGRWAAPVVMVEILPEAFPEYENSELMPNEFVPMDEPDSL